MENRRGKEKKFSVVNALVPEGFMASQTFNFAKLFS